MKKTSTKYQHFHLADVNEDAVTREESITEISSEVSKIESIPILSMKFFFY